MAHPFDPEVTINNDSVGYSIYQDEKSPPEVGNIQEASDKLASSSDSGSFSWAAHMTLPRKRNPVKDSVVCQSDKNRTKHEEAALYVREGEDDAKFYHHPASPWSKRAYNTLHHPIYHALHLLVCIFLLLLAFAESPTVGEGNLSDKNKKMLISVHGALELIFLLLLGCDLVIRLVWLRVPHFLKHRTALLTIVLLMMYVEVLAVLIRQQNHLRILRLLRPCFLIDTHYMAGMRRILRQIFKSIKPIVDVLFLLIFFIAVFALFGYLAFADMDPKFFESFARSYVSLFITQTTANNPDVMMESYSYHPATPIFFIIYIILTFYFASNILLAVVYSSFSDADKTKFRKILCHKRHALNKAFGYLVYNPKEEIQAIQFDDFALFMAYYKPRIPEWQVMCIYKALCKRSTEEAPLPGLTLEDFQRFYEVINYKWEELGPNEERLEWFSRFPNFIRKPIKAIHAMVMHRVYKFVIGVVVLANFIFLITCLGLVGQDRFEKLRRVLPVSASITFLLIYVVDILANIIGHGPNYFKNFWNIADFIMVIFSAICLGLEVNYLKFAIVRPLKLLRLIYLKRRYRDLMNTMVALAPRLLSVFFLVLIIYYSFAIIGMEFFASKVSQGCCNNSWYGVQDYYSASVESINSTVTDPAYYLNSFNNILRSYVTLFILMVVNNWYIIMEGIASEVDHGWLARIYFMAFYIITLVVLQVIISFIVEAFVLKIQAMQKNIDVHEEEKTEKITLEEASIAKLRYETVYLTELQRKVTFNKFIKWCRRKDFTKIASQTRAVQFLGRRDHTKEDLHMLVYKDEIENWYKDLEKYIHSRDPKQPKTSLQTNRKDTLMKVMMKLKNVAKEVILFIVD